MLVDEILKHAIRETEDSIRKRIGDIAESTFEDERRKGYTEGALEFGEEICSMVTIAKEKIRNDCSRDLDSKKVDIVRLWETIISRTASFQIYFVVTTRLIFFASIICLIFGGYTAAIILGIITVLSFIVSVVPGLMQFIMFILTGSFRISDKLLVKYYEYGRMEAALFFADYRDISRIQERQKTWVYTTSHRTASLE